jgi:hypothetical protein
MTRLLAAIRRIWAGYLALTRCHACDGAGRICQNCWEDRQW